MASKQGMYLHIKPKEAFKKFLNTEKNRAKCDFLVTMGNSALGKQRHGSFKPPYYQALEWKFEQWTESYLVAAD